MGYLSLDGAADFNVVIRTIIVQGQGECLDLTWRNTSSIRAGADPRLPLQNLRSGPAALSPGCLMPIPSGRRSASRSAASLRASRRRSIYDRMKVESAATGRRQPDRHIRSRAGSARRIDRARRPNVFTVWALHVAQGCQNNGSCFTFSFFRLHSAHFGRRGRAGGLAWLGWSRRAPPPARTLRWPALHNERAPFSPTTRTHWLRHDLLPLRPPSPLPSLPFLSPTCLSVPPMSAFSALRCVHVPLASVGASGAVSPALFFLPCLPDPTNPEGMAELPLPSVRARVADPSMLDPSLLAPDVLPPPGRSFLPVSCLSGSSSARRPAF